MDKKILEVLKPKAASFGFTKEELQSVAKNLADNLLLKDDATDEETAEAITKAVDGVLPILKMSQSALNRIIESKNKDKDKDKDKDNPDKDKDKDKDKDESDEPAWFKAYRESMEKRMNDMEQGKRNEGYSKKAKERFKEMDEDFANLALEGKTFASDEEFETFATGLETKWSAYQQKLADRGLKISAKPSKGGGTKEGELPDALKSRIEENGKDAPSPLMGV